MSNRQIKIRKNKSGNFLNEAAAKFIERRARELAEEMTERRTKSIEQKMHQALKVAGETERRAAEKQGPRQITEYPPDYIMQAIESVNVPVSPGSASYSESMQYVPVLSIPVYVLNMAFVMEHEALSQHRLTGNPMAAEQRIEFCHITRGRFVIQVRAFDGESVIYINDKLIRI